MSHSPEFLKLTQDAAKRVREISIEETYSRSQQPNAILVDVREESEWNAGHAEGAIHLGKGIIERDIEARIPNKDATILCYCGGGYRSLLVADNLQKMGYKNIYSVATGYKGWVQAELPVTRKPEVVPRSPSEKLGGISVLPRAIDKIRIFPSGKLPPHDLLNANLDKQLFDFLCIEPVIFEEIVKLAQDDEMVLTGLKTRLATAWPSDNAIYEFNEKMARRKPENFEGVSRFYVSGQHPAPPKKKIETLFDQIDWEEGRL